MADEVFSALDAASSFSRADPTAVGGDARQQAAGAPEVQEQATTFKVEDATITATIPKNPDAAISMQTPAGTLKITPLGVASDATSGQAVNDSAAVVYANTGQDSDTSVVPQEKGIETFTNIRSEDARENYSASVDLPGDETLKQIDHDTVAIVDPTPADKPSEQSLPGPAQLGSAAADQARATSGIKTPDPDPDHARGAAAAVKQAGTDRPPDVSSGAIQAADKPSEQQIESLLGRSPAHIGPGAPTRSEADGTLHVKAAAAKIDRQARDAASVALRTTKRTGAESTATMNANNDASADDQAVVVAKVSAPSAVDADGKKVETSLSVDGDVITMHVDHKDESVAYPIAADPEYELVFTRWNIAWFPELVQETYVSYWAAGYAYIGNWHPIYCVWGWVGCSSIGAGWYNAYQGATQNVAYWPAFDWGPVWQTYYYPVYATRWVVARWIPYWAPDLSSAALATVIESGGEEVYEPGDQDNGDIGDDSSIYFARMAVQTRPSCRRINRAITVAGFGGGNVKFRYCWNRVKKKVSLDSQYDNEVTSWTSTAAQIATAGTIGTEDNHFSPNVLSLDGVYRAAFDGHGHFNFSGHVGVGPITIGKNLMDVDWGVVARYDGSWCPYYKNQRQQSCGI